MFEPKLIRVHAARSAGASAAEPCVHRVLHSSLLRVCWMLQWIALTATAGWLLCDPHAERLLQFIGTRWENGGAGIATLWSDVAMRVGWGRLAMAISIAAAAAVSLTVWTGMVWRQASRPFEKHARAFRSLKSLLVLTAISAAWFGLAAGANSLVWQGKRTRLMWQIPELERIVTPLKQRWPERDGSLDPIGPFMAYPFGAPTVLILMQPPEVVSDELSISAIERRDSGALLLQLGGTVGDDWVEWHPESSSPNSFCGGLSDFHEFESSTTLGDGWYLVRYES